MNVPFVRGVGNEGKPDPVACVPRREPDSRPGPDVAFLSALPGVVLYQRIVTPDEQIRYTYISEGARDLFGVSPEEIVSDPHALFALSQRRVQRNVQGTAAGCVKIAHDMGCRGLYRRSRRPQKVYACDCATGAQAGRIGALDRNHIG
jgi:hypothetical protein